MPRNIELKARIASLLDAREIARRIATEHLGTLHQIDTYFDVPRGRMKLREHGTGRAELIAYHRGNAAQARQSDYVIVPVAEPSLLKQAFHATLGVRAVVQKAREVFLYHNVRIHLDRVADLGDFIEFEAVLGGEIDDTVGHEQLRWLCQEFGISAAEIESQSYGDLVLIAPPRENPARQSDP